MIKRTLLSLLALLAVAGGYLFSLLPLLVARNGLAGGQFSLALLIWSLLVLVTLPPLLTALCRKIWFFPGLGEAIAPELLHALLMEVNTMNCPVRVRSKGKKMVVSWRLDDPSWCERIQLSGMKRAYELWLTFDSATRTVQMIDRRRKIRFVRCPDKVKQGLFTNPSPQFRVSYGPDWGLDNYRQALAADYSFQPGEIKSPLLSTILKNGWNVRFNLL
jgi:hypothetical protein